MALEHAAKTNNKHTCQILAAVVKYIWILLREAEHMHNYANMLIGFQQPSYSRWICTSRVLPVTQRATRSGLCTCAATVSTAADAPPWGLLSHCQDGGSRPGRNQQRGQTRYGAEHRYGDVNTTDLAIWGRALDNSQHRTLQGVQSIGEKCFALA